MSAAKIFLLLLPQHPADRCVDGVSRRGVAEPDVALKMPSNSDVADFLLSTRSASSPAPAPADTPTARTR